MSVQVGWGYDSHPFIKGRPLIMGGVRIPYEKGLKGHSDADVVCHAVIDALLGATALGDIGTFFPDNDPRYKNADSLELLKKTVEFVSSKFKIIHMDVTILAEAPKVGPFKQRMRANLSRFLCVSADHVSLKGKTNEGMGFIGKKQGIACVAVATVERNLRKKRKKKNGS